MYKCKTYLLLKDVDVSLKNSKLKSRVFMSYLIDYNSTNIFRVWNSEKDDVNDYRDVIFDKSELYDIYNKSDSLVTQERKQIELQKESAKISINRATELNSDDEEWLETSIRDKLILESTRSVELKSSSQQARSEESKLSSQQTTDQQSIDDLIQSLIQFKVSDSKIKSFKKNVVSDSSVVEYSSLFESSSSSSQSESFDKRSLKQERSDVDSFRSHNKSIESIKDEMIAMNLANRIEKMNRRYQSKKNVALTDVDQANIMNKERVKFVSKK